MEGHHKELKRLPANIEQSDTFVGVKHAFQILWLWVTTKYFREYTIDTFEDRNVKLDVNIIQ